MSTPSFDPGIAGGKVVEVDLPINAGITKAAREAARTVKLDGSGHVIPPPGAETFGQALLDLPNDLMEWATGWLDDLDLTSLLTPLLTLVSGGMLSWLTVGFLGFRIFSMGQNMIANRNMARGPVSLVYYTIPSATVEPVSTYLRNSVQVKIKEIRPDDQGNTSLGIPIYHRGKVDRAFAHLQTKTGLKYSTLG